MPVGKVMVNASETMDSLSKNGFVMDTNVDMNSRNNNWDDSAIVNIFEDAVRKHRTKVSSTPVLICDYDVFQNDQLNGGLVRDSRQQTTKSVDAEIVSSKKKKARFNSSNVLNNQDPNKDNSESTSTLKNTNDKFSNALKAYSKSSENESTSFVISEGNVQFTVIDETSHSSTKPEDKNDIASSNIPSFDPSAGFPSSSTGSTSTPYLSTPLETALNDMLMAWYHSGYATGRYQTLLEIQQQQQPH